MKQRRFRRIVIPTLLICLFSVMTVLAATYTIADPIVTSTSSATKVYTKMDIAMNAVPDACLSLNVTPYYSLRGSNTWYIGSTKGISSYSGRVTQLKGSVNYVDNVDSHVTYKRLDQKGSVLISGSYNQVATKTTYIN